MNNNISSNNSKNENKSNNQEKKNVTNMKSDFKKYDKYNNSYYKNFQKDFYWKSHNFYRNQNYEKRYYYKKKEEKCNSEKKIKIIEDNSFDTNNINSHKNKEIFSELDLSINKKEENKINNENKLEENEYQKIKEENKDENDIKNLSNLNNESHNLIGEVHIENTIKNRRVLSPIFKSYKKPETIIEKEKGPIRYKHGDNIKDHKKYFETKQKEKNYRMLNKMNFSDGGDIIIQNEEICEICYTKYKQNNVPVIFRYCGHTFCEVCAKEESIEVCPICKKKKKIVSNLILAKNYLTENDFLCLGCKFSFNEKEREPILFGKCGHTFCRICSLKFYNKSYNTMRCPIDSTLTKIENNQKVVNYIFKNFIRIYKDLVNQDLEDYSMKEIGHCFTHFIPFVKASGKHSNKFHRVYEKEILDNLFNSIDLATNEFLENYENINQYNIDFGFPVEEIRALNSDMVEIQYFEKSTINKIQKKLSYNFENIKKIIENYDSEYIPKIQQNNLNSFFDNCANIKKKQKKFKKLFENYEELKLNRENDKENKIFHLPSFLGIFTKINNSFDHLIKDLDFPINTAEFNQSIFEYFDNILNESLLFFSGIKENFVYFKKLIEKTINDVDLVNKNLKDFQNNLENFKNNFRIEKKTFENDLRNIGNLNRSKEGKLIKKENFDIFTKLKKEIKNQNNFMIDSSEEIELDKEETDKNEKIIIPGFLKNNESFGWKLFKKIKKKHFSLKYWKFNQNSDLEPFLECLNKLIVI